MSDNKKEGIEFEIEQAKKKILEQAPEHIIELGNILRRSIETNEIDEFREFMKKHHSEIEGQRKLETFRDLLIISRIDTKDLEPEARVRLRIRTLSSENPMVMSADYRAAGSNGHIPSCRNCRWFVTPPNDGDEKSEKSCVEMGTKGADQACYGFTVLAVSKRLNT